MKTEINKIIQATQKKKWREENIKLLLTDRSTPIINTREVITWVIN